VKEERWHRFMAAQQEVSRDVLRDRVGKTIEVLIDEVGPDGAVGRSKWDAPEIDGLVRLPAGAALRPGEMIRARVESTDDYDLVARHIQ
jgi:ribosomal protein S12 methylthiotransferase